MRIRVGGFGKFVRRLGGWVGDGRWGRGVGEERKLAWWRCELTYWGLLDDWED